MDVVKHMGARIQRRFGHRGPVGVDAYGQIYGVDDGSHQRVDYGIRQGVPVPQWGTQFG